MRWVTDQPIKTWNFLINISVGLIWGKTYHDSGRNNAQNDDGGVTDATHNEWEYRRISI